jgi:hypothetical protein
LAWARRRRRRSSDVFKIASIFFYASVKRMRQLMTFRWPT